MNIYISGGCKNGKSTAAEDMAVALSERTGGKRYYVATMIPYDDEDRARVRKHVENRKHKGFQTIEQGRDIGALAAAEDGSGTYLIDSVTALLLNEMFTNDYNGEADPEAPKRCIEGLRALMEKAANVICVSDYIFSDAVLYDEFTQTYRRMLAETDRKTTENCDAVIEYVSGIPVYYKGEGLL